MQNVEILVHAVEELEKAQSKFPPFNSAHEGYAVILEELDELFEAIRRRDLPSAYVEATQVAAMALRFMDDIKGMRPS